MSANVTDCSGHALNHPQQGHYNRAARTRLTVGTHLPLLVDDGYCVLQLDVKEEAGEEDVGYTNQAVVLLLVKEWVSPLEVATHHLRGEDMCAYVRVNVT